MVIEEKTENKTENKIDNKTENKTEIKLENKSEPKLENRIGSKENARKKLLVLGNYQDAIYHNFSGVDEQIKLILEEKYTVHCTDKFEVLEGDLDYAGIISYVDLWKGTLSEQQAIQLLSYVEGGGGFCMLHNGISIQNHEQLVKMIGAKFLSHPKMEELTFETKPHPITEGIKTFLLFEEPYQLEVLDEKDLCIFLTYSYQGKEYLAGYSKEVGKGRVVYLVPGHTVESFEQKEYQKLMKQSIDWCCNK